MNNRRGSVIVVVIWAVAIAAVLVAATQIVTFRQAVLGREALARVEARWSARAGLEQMIAIMEYYHEYPNVDDPMAVVRDMESYASGETESGTWDIRHFNDGVEWLGPRDEGSKLNINRATKAQLMTMDHMTPDVVDAIFDWKDTNNEVEGLGAERDYYDNRAAGYHPRNGNFRSFAELELVAGAWPEYARGEDWNLNGRLDPNEDDGSRTPPDDKPDGKLDAGWSQYLTATSKQSKYSLSGQERLRLQSATLEDLINRTGVDENQAKALQQFGRQSNVRVENLLVTPLSQVSGGTSGQQSQQNSKSGSSANNGSTSGRSSAGSSGSASSSTTVKDLTPQQLRAVLRETTTEDYTQPMPGRINLNTASAPLLKEILNIDSRLADAIIGRRKAKAEGITSLADLAGISGMNNSTLAALAQQFDVTSSVYTVNSRGRSRSTGAEVEIEAVVDRSELPARILSYREQ